MRALPLLLVLASASLAFADSAPDLSPSEVRKLEAGECVVLDRRPGETAKTEDSRFTTVAKYVKGSRATIWETINDKENATRFLEGVLESKVVEREGNVLVVEQRTRVGGPKGSYHYRLRHALSPMSHAEFTYAGGELKDVAGAWWIFDGPSPAVHLVLYSLHIDAGFFAPQPVVKAGMRRQMPGTVECIAREVARREASR